MKYRITNADMTVEVEDRGGELQSVKKDGTEYLWQGDPAIWGDRAPNLFPYIARLTQGKYRLHGTEYEMPMHGFVLTSQLQVQEQQENKIVLRLDADEQTKAYYPFEFTYRIIYEVKDTALYVTYEVENRDAADMYFGIGGHPGFLVPMEEGLAFGDYYLEFGSECSPVRVGFSPDCYVNGQDKAYPLTGGRVLPLTHSLFDEDAIVLKDMARQVSIRSRQGERGVTVSYPHMDYLGIWHMPHTQAPYVCIEPWASLPSRKDVIEELTEQPGIVRLNAGETYVNSWSIEVR